MYGFFADEDGSGRVDAMMPAGEGVPGPDGAIALPGQASVGAEVHDALQTMMPWMISLLFHLGIAIFALFATWVIIPAVSEEDVVIIPTARLSDTPGGRLSQAQGVDLQATQNVRNIQAEEVATGEALGQVNTGINSSIDGSAVELVGLAGGGAGGGSTKLAPFGTTSGTGTGLGASFYGTGGNARKIIYMVDASGSLIDTLPFVMKELKDSISGLSEQQQYTIVFFQDGEPIEVPPAGWKQATPENKRKTFEFLAPGNVVPRGKTSPDKALKLGMRYKPELMFILSDNITGRGEYEVDREQLLRFLNEVNKDGKTTINTIQFLYPDQLETLKDIAAEHKGIYKFITEADLGLQ